MRTQHKIQDRLMDVLAEPTEEQKRFWLNKHNEETDYIVYDEKGTRNPAPVVKSRPIMKIVKKDKSRKHGRHRTVLEFQYEILNILNESPTAKYRIMLLIENTNGNQMDSMIDPLSTNGYIALSNPTMRPKIYMITEKGKMFLEHLKALKPHLKELEPESSIARID